MKSKFDLLELYFQKFIETSADLFGQDEQINLVRSLIYAIETELESGFSTKEVVPSNFTIYMSPNKYTLWHSDKEWIDRFSFALHEAAVEVGLQISMRPVISLEMMPDLSDDQIQVHIPHFDNSATKTTNMATDTVLDTTLKTDPRINAFLILENGTHFPMVKSVINIGRREENDLVIDDPHVSREHAQIRLMKDTYFLFDLNSTAGTYVNGRKIDQYLLKLGDVISISDHPIIYVQEESMEKEAQGKEGIVTETTRINIEKKEENKPE